MYDCGAPVAFLNDGQQGTTFSSQNVHKYLTDSKEKVYFGWRFAGFIHSDDNGNVEDEEEVAAPAHGINMMHKFLEDNLHIVAGNDGYRVNYSTGGGIAAKCLVKVDLLERITTRLFDEENEWRYNYLNMFQVLKWKPGSNLDALEILFLNEILPNRDHEGNFPLV